VGNPPDFLPSNAEFGHYHSTQRTEQGHWLIRVESTLEGVQCRRCSREIRDLYGWDTAVRLRHLPLFDVPVFVEIRPKRYRCLYCSGNPTTPPCEWYEPRSPNTKAYEQWALRMLINSTVWDAARKLDVSEETIDGLLDRWIVREVDWTAWEWLGVIGIGSCVTTVLDVVSSSMIDFPIDELLDDGSCTRWLERHLHPDGLTCPHCGHSERRLFLAQGHFPAYRGRACQGYYTLLTGTVFAKTRQRPATLCCDCAGLPRASRRPAWPVS
jgi:hypothetical protein